MFIKHVPLVDAILQLSNSCVKSAYPMTFEKLGQVNYRVAFCFFIFISWLIDEKGLGFVLYYTDLKDTNVDGKILTIPGVRDRAYIQIGSLSCFFFARIVRKKKLLFIQ